MSQIEGKEVHYAVKQLSYAEIQNRQQRPDLLYISFCFLSDSQRYNIMYICSSNLSERLLFLTNPLNEIKWRLGPEPNRVPTHKNMTDRSE